VAELPITFGTLLDELDGDILPDPKTIPTTFGKLLDQLDGVILPDPSTVPITFNSLLDRLDGIILEGPYVRGYSPPPTICVDASTAVVTFDIVSLLPDTVDLPTVVVTVTFDGASPETVYTGSAFQGLYITNSTVTPTTTGLENIQSFYVERNGGWPADVTVAVQVTGKNTPSAEDILEGYWEWCTFSAGCGFMFFQRGYDTGLAEHVYWTSYPMDSDPAVTVPMRSGSPLFGYVVLNVLGDIE